METKKERESTVWKAMELCGLGIWKIMKKNHGVGASNQVKYFSIQKWFNLKENN